MPRLLRILPFLVFLTIIGCNSAPTQGLGGQPAQPFYKIISLSPSTTDLVGTYNPNRRALVGRTAVDHSPQGVQAVPVVANVKPDYEKIAQIKPDLVVLDGALYNEADMEKIKQIGARKVFVVDADTVEKFMAQMRELGQLIGAETALNEYADKIYLERATAQASIAKAIPKVAVMMPGGGGSEHMIAGKGSFDADLVRSVGAEPVGPDGDRFVNANPETLVTMNPDVIVVAGNPDAIVNDPRYKAVKAVVSRRVFGVKNPDILLQRGTMVTNAIKFLADAVNRK